MLVEGIRASRFGFKRIVIPNHDPLRALPSDSKPFQTLSSKFPVYMEAHRSTPLSFCVACGLNGWPLTPRTSAVHVH